MATNLAIDDRLIEEARKSGKLKTKKEAVRAALREYIQWQRQQRILGDFGAIDFDPKYDWLSGDESACDGLSGHADLVPVITSQSS